MTKVDNLEKILERPIASENGLDVDRFKYKLCVKVGQTCGTLRTKPCKKVIYQNNQRVYCPNDLFESCEFRRKYI